MVFSSGEDFWMEGVIPADFFQHRAPSAHLAHQEAAFIPTVSGLICSKVMEFFSTPSACIPALWAKALEPTYGSPRFSRMFATSAILRAVSVSRGMLSSGIQAQPILSWRFGMMVERLALPPAPQSQDRSPAHDRLRPPPP